MIVNETLKIIKQRRSIRSFKDDLTRRKNYKRYWKRGCLLLTPGTRRGILLEFKTRDCWID